MRGWRELQIREYGDIVMTSGDSPSYTADTLRRLKEKYPDKTFNKTFISK